MNKTTEELWAEYGIDPTGQTPLHPDLVPYLREGRFGTMIKHKFVNEVLYTREMHGRYNKQYEYKLEATEKARDERRWHTFIMLHERPWRLDALLEIDPLMTDTEWWEAVVDVWIDSENIRENQEEWDDILRSLRPGHEAMMNDEERKALAAKKDEFLVYQGYTSERDDGWSWTTRRKTAEWFGRRFAQLEGGDPMLAIGKVRRDHVLAYLLGRGEYEILIDPDDVRITSTHAL